MSVGITPGENTTLSQSPLLVGVCVLQLKKEESESRLQVFSYLSSELCNNSSLSGEKTISEEDTRLPKQNKIPLKAVELLMFS